MKKWQYVKNKNIFLQGIHELLLIYLENIENHHQWLIHVVEILQNCKILIFENTFWFITFK